VAATETFWRRCLPVSELSELCLLFTRFALTAPGAVTRVRRRDLVIGVTFRGHL